MSALLDAWRAGRVRRWHTNPHLARTDDYVDGHSARVTILALTLCPSLSRDGLIYALTHDHGEHAVGDMSYMIKLANPQIAESLAEMEDQKRREMGFPDSPEGREGHIVKLADWLDAWLWMFHHTPQLAARADWLAQLADARRLAVECEVSAPVEFLIQRAMEATRDPMR